MPDDNTQPTSKWLSRWRPHRLAKVSLIPRSFAYYHSFGLSVWIALLTGEGWSLILPAIFLLIWPSIAYCHSALANDSKRAEFRNMYIDCLLLGGWCAMLDYYIWVTLALGLGCMLNNLVVGGTHRLLRAALFFTLGAVGLGLFTGFHFRPYVGVGPDIYQASGYLIYFLALGYTMYGQNRKIGRNIREIQFKNRIFKSLLDIGAVADRAADIHTLLEESLQSLCSNFPEYGFAVYLYEHQRPEVTRYAAVSGIDTDTEKHLLRLLADIENHREGIIHLYGDDYGHQYYAASMTGRLSLYEGWLLIRVPRENNAIEDMLAVLIDELAAATENKLLHFELRKAAERDGLTGLYNRGFFESTLQESIQYKFQRPDFDFAILMVDVDGLKEVNDHFGHVAGDKLIISVAEYLHKHCREGDILARYGGDEFVVLCPASDIHAANCMLNRVRNCLDEQRFIISVIDDQPVEVKLSLSMGTASSENTPAQEVLTIADKRMYANKIERRQNRGFN